MVYVIFSIYNVTMRLQCSVSFQGVCRVWQWKIPNIHIHNTNCTCTLYSAALSCMTCTCTPKVRKRLPLRIFTTANKLDLIDAEIGIVSSFKSLVFQRTATRDYISRNVFLIDRSEVFTSIGMYFLNFFINVFVFIRSSSLRWSSIPFLWRFSEAQIKSLTPIQRNLLHYTCHTSGPSRPHAA
jgi:hypothetical protein